MSRTLGMAGRKAIGEDGSRGLKVTRKKVKEIRAKFGET